MNHHKVTPKFGICIGCEEPTLTSNLTHDGYCPDCEQKRMEAYYCWIQTEAARNHIENTADIIQKCNAYFF